MAELTNLESKLGEVVGLAMAAQEAGQKVAKLAKEEGNDELVGTLERMRAQAKETEQRGTEVASSFEGKKTAILDEARDVKGKAQEMMKTYLDQASDTLDGFESGATVDPAALRAKGLVAKRGLVKVLGRGDVTKSLTVKAHAFSDKAKQAIEGAGGSTETIPLPWGERRPPAKGNALTNR